MGDEAARGFELTAASVFVEPEGVAECLGFAVPLGTLEHLRRHGGKHTRLSPLAPERKLKRVTESAALRASYKAAVRRHAGRLHWRWDFAIAAISVGVLALWRRRLGSPLGMMDVEDILIPAAVVLGADVLWYVWTRYETAPFNVFVEQSQHIGTLEDDVRHLEERGADAHRRVRLRELLNLAMTDGCGARLGGDHHVQDEWASRTQKLVVSAFGVGDSLRFITAHDRHDPPTDNGALFGRPSPKNFVIQARLDYLEELIDSVETAHLDDDFKPETFEGF